MAMVIIKDYGYKVRLKVYGPVLDDVIKLYIAEVNDDNVTNSFDIYGTTKYRIGTYTH